MNIATIQKYYFGLYEKGKHILIARGVRAAAKKCIDTQFSLNKEQLREACAFWKPYGKFSTVFHSFYTQKTGIFVPEYLPTDIYLNIVDEYFNNRQESQVMDNKCYYPSMFNATQIKQPQNVAFRMNGFWYDEKMEMISKENLRNTLNEHEAVFLKKATRSFGGKGVVFVDASNADIYSQVLEDTKSWKEDIVIQCPLRQHALLSALNDSSVNTIRILSMLSHDGVKIYSSILRMGVAGAKVDNASSGGVTCGITEEGKLKRIGYKPTGEAFEKHPTSGVIFEGYEIPGFEKAKQLVRKAHPMIPHFRLVSWDIAIDEDGNAIMVEANLAKGELDFHQLNNGPLFGEDTKKILDEVFGRTK